MFSHVFSSLAKLAGCFSLFCSRVHQTCFAQEPPLVSDLIASRQHSFGTQHMVVHVVVGSVLETSRNIIQNIKDRIGQYHTS